MIEDEKFFVLMDHNPLEAWFFKISKRTNSPSAINPVDPNCLYSDFLINLEKDKYIQTGILYDYLNKWKYEDREEE